MKELFNKIKFEHVLIMFIVIVLTGVMLVNIEMNESAKIALLAITNLLSGVAGFMWGIKQISKIDK